MILTWKSTVCPIFGDAFELHGLRDGESASCRRHGVGKFIANAFIGGRYLSHVARTKASAMARLEKEIDRRSIGLFGVDDVTFVQP